MIALRSWNKLIFVVAYHSVFTGFTITISYFQVFYILFILSFPLYFQVFPSFCIFRIYFSSVLPSLFFKSQFFTYILVYFQVTYWHTDILTYRQWWFHRIPFRLKEEVQKSTLELQQFSRVSGKNLPGKKPRWGVRGRAGVRLGIGLGLESGGLFSGGLFSQNLWDL